MIKTNSRSRFWSLLGALKRNRQGIAAVEFALTLPVVLLLYFGSVEFSQAVAVKRITVLSASTVANLVTQYSTISAANTMPDILNAASAVLAPYPVANATVRVSCITIDGAGNATVLWSKSLNGTALATGSQLVLPAAFATPNTSVIFGEATYTLRSVVDYLQFGAFNLTSSVYMFPRSASGTVILTP